MTAITKIGRAKLVSLSIAVVAVPVAGVLSITMAGAGTPKPTAATSPAVAQGQTVTVTSAQSPAAVDHASLSVSGSVNGLLAPGVTRPVTVTVQNTGHQPDNLLSVSIVVGNASSTCTAARNLQTTGWTASSSNSNVIKAGATVSVPLTITMLDLQDLGAPGTNGFTSGNQDACQAKNFPLTFTATAKIG